MTLEYILQKHFNCASPFLKKKKLIGHYDGGMTYDYLTKNGSIAYARLIDLIYDLEKLGVIFDSDSIIEELDKIVSLDEF